MCIPTNKWESIPPPPRKKQKQLHHIFHQLIRADDIKPKTVQTEQCSFSFTQPDKSKQKKEGGRRKRTLSIRKGKGSGEEKGENAEGGTILQDIVPGRKSIGQLIIKNWGLPHLHNLPLFTLRCRQSFHYILTLPGPLRAGGSIKLAVICPFLQQYCFQFAWAITASDPDAELGQVITVITSSEIRVK